MSTVSSPAPAQAGYAPGELTVHAEPAALRAVTSELRAAGRTIVLVPTMGALHDGHLELIRQARGLPAVEGTGGPVVPVVSIFVNPLQFGPGEDLERYPRPLAADLAKCREAGVELVLTPGVEHMYPPGSTTRITPGPLAAELEGAIRPGHFAGVLTVVAKLFHIAGPDVAVFGEKDYQQLVLIRQMVRDLDFPLSVVGVPTVREPDGLARSSRNAYLSAEQRARAATLARALHEGAAQGPRGPAAVVEHAREVLAAEAAAPGFGVEYLELRDPDLGPAPAAGPARLLVAARIGSTRLIDNVPVQLGE